MAYFVYLLLVGGLIFTFVLATCARTSGDLFSTHIPKPIDLFSINTTSSDEVCTLGNFTAYFVYLLFLGELIFIWLTCARFSGDLVCTHTSSCLTYSLQVPPLHGLVFTPVILWRILFISFSLGTLFTWEIYYDPVQVTLVIYSVHVPPLVDLFCTYGTFWWLILVTYPPMT